MIYADASVLAAAYLGDEQAFTRAVELLGHVDEPVITSQISVIELASALWAAERAGRLASATRALERFDADSGVLGLVGILALDADRAFGRARRLLAEHPLRTMDAVHVSVALDEAARSTSLTFMTADRRQARAAEAAGLGVELIG